MWGGRYKRPLASRDFIGLWKEKRYRRNMMFLFAGHSDKPLKSLISMAHKGNHICLYRFSFIYAVNDLWEDAYICPINIMNRTTKSAIYVRELPEFKLWLLPLVTWIDGLSQLGCCVLHSLGLIKNRTVCFQERLRLLSLAAVLRKHPSWFQNPITLAFEIAMFAF